MVDTVQETAGTGARRRARAAAAGTAVLAAVAVWLVAVPVFGQDLAVTYPGTETMTVGIGAVLFSALGASLAGWGLLALLELIARARARLVWTAIAAVALALSFSPVVQVEAAGSTRATLALLHLAVGLPLIVGLRRAR
jgi:hypothetical protein